MTVIAFDLDGTISDPADGITASINYALEKLGQEPRPKESLFKYIGPGLVEIFSDLLGVADNPAVEHAVGFYRDRYGKVGYRENTLYSGIIEVLAELKDRNIPLYVATAKRQDMAEAVINHFELGKYFSNVYGCGSSRKKHDLLREILNQEQGTKQLYMIGDRSNDMLAGKQVSATCVGVTWGYGDATELESSGAHHLVGSPSELLELLY